MTTVAPDVGVVVLTMGTRPVDLDHGLRSVLGQQGVTLDVIVVGNGWEPAGLPPGVRTLGLPQNIGIPAGRNAGAHVVAGDVLFFLDDDASLAAPDTLARIVALLDRRPEIGLVQPRVLDPSGIPPPGRWVPRLITGDPARSSPATSLWEGAVAVRRGVFERCRGWPELFFYAHEGIELCWRVWDAGSIPWYAGDIVVHHPVIDPRRHAEFWRLNARNRVLLARRNLPAVLRPAYVGSWALITTARVRDPSARAAWWAGFREGWTMDPGDVHPMRWRSVWRLTRAGRPPVV